MFGYKLVKKKDIVGWRHDVKNACRNQKKLNEEIERIEKIIQISDLQEKVKSEIYLLILFAKSWIILTGMWLIPDDYRLSWLTKKDEA